MTNREVHLLDACALGDPVAPLLYHDWLLDQGRALDATAVQATLGAPELKSFADLQGMVLARVVCSGNQVILTLVSGKQYRLYHAQECCESVWLEDVVGDWTDLIGRPLLTAEERRNSNAPPLSEEDTFQDSYTWTYYHLRGRDGSLDLRWYGRSNGYYSESVDFEVCSKEED